MAPSGFSLKGRIRGPLSADEPGDFRTTTTVNQFDILQLLRVIDHKQCWGERIANGLAFRSYDHGFRNASVRGSK